MKIDYQTKFILGYSIVTTISVIFSFIKITQLESVLNAAVKQKMDVKSSYFSRSSSACVWGVGPDDSGRITEFVAAHFSQGIMDFTFYVNGDHEYEHFGYITSNFTNIGLNVGFKKATLKHHDLWDCLTDNVFNPYVEIVYTADLDSFIFPLHDQYARVHTCMDNKMCVSFKQYNFYENPTLDNIDNSFLGSYRNRTSEYRTSGLHTRIYTLGATSDERVMFLKNYRLRKFKCPMSKTHGIGKLMINVLPKGETFVDNRMFDLKYSYHIQKF